MMEPAEPVLKLTDPRALRAYAHPIRMALLSLLRREGPKTATEAAPAVGESVASCSFHLRQLARYGLIEPVEGAHGRAKPWRATAQFTTWPADADDPALAAAATALERQILDAYFRGARTWLAQRDTESAPWRRVGQASDFLVYLTAAEARRLNDRMDALVEEFVPRNHDPGQRPKGSRPVKVVRMTFPSDEFPDLRSGESTVEGEG